MKIWSSAVKILAAAILLGLFANINTFAQFAATGTTSVSITVASEAALRIDTPTTSLTTTGTVFNNYTGTTNFTYKIRTSQGTGTGTITAQVTSDFSGSGGPSVATPPSAGDALVYSCTVATPGTACTGSQTASTTSSTSIATFGADAHSTVAGTGSNSVAWTLTNDPVYKTGTYAATVTFTISST